MFYQDILTFSINLRDIDGTATNKKVGLCLCHKLYGLLQIPGKPEAAQLLDKGDRHALPWLSALQTGCQSVVKGDSRCYHPLLISSDLSLSAGDSCSVSIASSN